MHSYTVVHALAIRITYIHACVCAQWKEKSYFFVGIITEIINSLQSCHLCTLDVGPQASRPLNTARARQSIAIRPHLNRWWDKNENENEKGICASHVSIWKHRNRCAHVAEDAAIKLPRETFKPIVAFRCM